MSETAVIAGYVRTPFHFAAKGDLAGVRGDDLAATTLKALVERTGVDPKEIEDYILGCAFPEGEQGFNVARMIVLLANMPITIGGVTVNRFCGSSMNAIHQAAGNIAAGAGHAFFCGGVESMSRVPMGGFNPMPHAELAKMTQAYISMGETAENLAKKYNITREEVDQFASDSFAKAVAAQEAGFHAGEIVPVITEKFELEGYKARGIKLQGKVTEVKVHSGKSTYYVKPNDPAGSALPGDAQSSTNRGAQWQVKEFELGNQNQSVGAEAAKVPAPPPAIPEPAKK